MNTYDFVYLLCGGFRAYTVYLMMGLFYTESGIGRKKEVLMYVIHYMMISMSYLILDVSIFNVVVNLAALFWVTLCYENSIRKRLFVSGVIFLVLVTVETTVVICLNIMKHSILENMDSNSIAALIFTRLLTLMVVMLLRILGKYLDVSMKGHMGLVLMIIPVYTMFESVLLYSGMILWEEIALINMVLALTVNFIVFYLYEQLDNVIRIKDEKRVVEEQNHFYELQMNVMMKHNEEIRSICHDINNNLNVLQGLLNKNEIEKTKIYLQKLLKSPGLEKDVVCSGNLVLDSILNYKIKIAKEKRIAVSTDIHIPEDISLDSIVWVTILGNLLDNAIEAAGQVTAEPYINMRISYNRKNVILILKNSYAGAIIEENGKFHTQKKNPVIHGIGLENVQRAIGEKGNLNITYTDDEFCAEVSMVV